MVTAPPHGRRNTHERVRRPTTGYPDAVTNELNPEPKQILVDSLISRVEPFIPLDTAPLAGEITGALAELGNWWQSRVPGHTHVATIDTSQGINFAAGSDAASAAIDSGANLFVLISSDNSCPREVRAIIGLLTRKDAFSVYFHDRGTSDQSAMQTIAEIRDLMRQHADIRGDALQLATLEPSVDFTSGVLLTASSRKTPVITGNAAHLAAALITQRLTMKASNWWRHGSTSSDPAVTQSVDRLGIPPGLDLDLTDHTGIGAQISAELLHSFIAG